MNATKIRISKAEANQVRCAAYHRGTMTLTPIDTALRSALAARIDRGETIYAIAKGAGVSWPVLSRYLSRSRSLNLASADKLAAYLGLRVRPATTRH